MKRLALIMPLLALSWSAPAVDIYTDGIPSDNIIRADSLPLSESSRKKSEALSRFAGALALAGSRNGGLEKKIADEFIKALESDPDSDTVVRCVFSDPGLIKGDYLERILRIASANPGAAGLNFRTAAALSKSGRNSEAAALLEKAIDAAAEKDSGKDSPTALPELLSLLGKILIKTGEFSRGDKIFSEYFKDSRVSGSFLSRTVAAEFYSAAAEKASAEPFLWIFGSDKAALTGKMRENLSALETLCSEKPRAVLEIAPLLELYSKNDMREGALTIVLDNLLHTPDSPGAMILLAAARAALGDSANAFRAWRIIAGRPPWSAQPAYLFELGRSALKCGRLKEASDALEWFLTSDPDNQAGLYLLGLCYYEMGMFQKASLKLGRLKPTPDALYLQALCLKRQGRLKEASGKLAEAEKVAAKEGNNNFLSKNFYITQAFFSDKAGDRASAERCLNILLEKDPADPEVLNFLGYMWAEEGKNLDRAESCVKTALEAEPDNQAYLDSMAWILHKKGDSAGAKVFMDKALKADPEDGGVPDAVIADHAGDIYSVLGDSAEALKFWETALRVRSDETDHAKIEAKIRAAREKLKIKD